MSDRCDRDPEDFADCPEEDEPDPDDYFEYMPQEQQQESEYHQMLPDQGNPWDDPEYVDKVNRRSCFSLNATLAGLEEWINFFADRIGCLVHVVPGDTEGRVNYSRRELHGGF